MIGILLNQVCEQIAEIEESSSELTITEHALLRYLERVEGVDLEEIKRKMLTEKNQKLIEALGAGKYPIEGTGARMVVKGTTIVSVVS